MTYSREVLAAILDRLRAAMGPDREIDARIMAALLAPAGAAVAQSPFNGAWCIYYGIDRGGRPRLWDQPPRADGWALTASIDAALALVERVLPDFCINITDWGIDWEPPHDRVRVRIIRDASQAFFGPDYRAPIIPLALLIALMSALIARCEGQPEGSAK